MGATSLGRSPRSSGARNAAVAATGPPRPASPARRSPGRHVASSLREISAAGPSRQRSAAAEAPTAEQIAFAADGGLDPAQPGSRQCWRRSLDFVPTLRACPRRGEGARTALADGRRHRLRRCAAAPGRARGRARPPATWWLGVPVKASVAAAARWRPAVGALSLAGDPGGARHGQRQGKIDQAERAVVEGDRRRRADRGAGDRCAERIRPGRGKVPSS